MKKTALTLSAVALLLAGILGFAPDAQAQGGKEGAQDPVTELHKRGFNILVAAISKTDFPVKFQSGMYTLLAPTDVAFRDIPKSELDALLADKEKLTTLLSNHIIEGKVTAADLKGGEFKTLGGTSVKTKSVDGKLKIGTATIVRVDLPSANGVIHGIDKLLQP